MANVKAKKRRKLIIFLAIVLVLAGLGALAIFKKRAPVITIQTEKVTRRNLTELVPANGKIQPVFQVKISPEVSGEITTLAVKEGQKVKKGDLLLKIKPDVYVAARSSSEANYKGALSSRLTAQANLKKAEIDLRRAAALHDSKLLPDADFLGVETTFDIATAQLQSSLHQVEMAQAALTRADEDLSKTTISSPLDGTVSRLNSQLGERVVGTAMMAGTEVMTIADLNEMEARVDIGEVDVVLIKVGQQARLEVDAYKDRKFNGTVTEIANSSKGSGGMGGGTAQDATKFEVKIRIKDNEQFRPGMSVTAEIETRYRTNVLTVPIASVTTRLPKPPGDGKKGAAGGPSAKTTNAPAGGTNTIAQTGTNAPAATASASGMTNATATAGGKKASDAPKPIEVVFLKDGERAKMVPVKLGISDDAYTEITEGLSENAEVISGGYKALRVELEDGKQVRIGTAASDKDKETK